MPDTNRYQQFLRETLQRGLMDLENEPSATEVVGIPKSSFEIFVRAFRSGLPPEIQKTLPAHNLTNKKYLEFLVSQIDNLLQTPAPEAEKILSNMPPLESLEIAFKKAHEGQTAAMVQHQTWQTTFAQQIKQYNLDLISRLDKQLQKEFPSLAGTQNAGKRKILVSDMAQTIQDQGLPAIKGDYKTQTESVLKNVAAKTIRQYASEIEDLQTEAIESRPQAREEKINAVSQAIAQEEADTTFTIRQEQIRAETLPTENPTYKVSAAVRTSVIANLPPELAENEEIVNTLVGEIEMQIHQAAGSEENYQQIMSQTVKNVLTRKNVQTKIAAAKIAFSPETQQNFINSVSQEITPEIYAVANSPTFATNTPFAGSGAPAPGPNMVTPPIPPPEILAPAVNIPAGGGVVQGPTASAIPGIGGAGASVIGYVAHGDPLELLQASGQPLHFLTVLASPTSAIDFGKYLITAGPIRSGFWFVWESFGLARPDYLQVGLFGLDRMQYDLFTSLNGVFDKKGNLLVMGLEDKLKHATSDFDKYKLGLEKIEAEKRLGFVNKIFEGIHNNPVLDGAYKAFFGEPGKLGGFGIYHLTHPWQAFTTRLYNNHILLGLGVDGIFGSLSAYAKYGGYGGAYVTQEYLKMFGVYLVKAAGVKLGLYGVYGQGMHRHYELKILHEINLHLKQFTSTKLSGLAKGGAALISKVPFIGKPLINGVKTIVAGLSSFAGKIGALLSKALLVLSIIPIAIELLKRVGKAVFYTLVALLAWLFSNFSLLEIIFSAGSGLLQSFLLSPLIPLPFGIFNGVVVWMFGTFNTALFIKTLHGVFGSLSEGAGSLFGKGVSLGGNFLTSLSHLPSLAGIAAPVLGITGGIITVGYIYTNMFLSSAFWLPTQLPQFQSSYLEVKKSASFSGKIGDPIKYTLLINVKVEKKDSKLINLKISDTTNSSCANQPPIIAERNFVDKIPGSITFTTPLSVIYEVPTNNSFNDCLITNTATVTADVENGPTGETSFYIASVSIGNPPFEYPSDWPVKPGCITQGPNTTKPNSHSGDQAIDIGKPASGDPVLGASVFATHKGTVSLAFRNHGIYGNYIIVDGSGDKAGFQSLYAHLQTISVTKGQVVARGTKLGTVGSTGTSTGPHLHYEFRGLKMGTPYLPVSVPACVGREICKICF